MNHVTVSTLDLREIAGFVAVHCRITLIPDYWFNLLAAAAGGRGC